MNVVTAHLEAVFDAYPQTSAILDAKAELQTMMEDAYEGLLAIGATPSDASARVIADFGNLDELAPALGVATHHAHSRDSGDIETSPIYPPVTLVEARNFSETARVAWFQLGTAVAAFVASPIPVVLLIAFADAGLLPLTVEAAIGVGIGLLLLIATGGALSLVRMSNHLAPYERLRTGRFTPNATVEHWAGDLAASRERRRATSLAVAVALWVLSPLPLILSALAEPTPLQGLWIAGGAALILAAVASGLLIQLPSTWARYVAEKLTGP